MWLSIFLVGIILWLLYKYWTYPYKYWQRRGVVFLPGHFPFGSDSRLTTLSQYEGYTHDEMCKKFPSEPYFGIYVIRNPILIVKSPEVLKTILSTEFSHFRDRHFFKIHDSDVLAQDLFDISGEKWRPLRVKLTPTFTSGKLKTMFPIFLKCSENYEALISSKADFSIDVKDSVSRFTMDAICNCAFGLDVNTISNPDNELRKAGIKSLEYSTRVMIVLTLNTMFPEIFKFFPVRFYDSKLEKFFVNLVKDTVEYREKNNIKRNDFLDLLIQMKNNNKIGEEVKDETKETLVMTIEMMTAQCFVFLAAGFETSSSVQSFLLYELALNPDIQKKLQNEIDEVLQKHGGLTYESIAEMKYLDSAISETMRKYPTLPQTTRVCTKSLTLPGGLKTEVGDCILIPLWSLHHDPQYFPNPDKFDPERFSPENKDTIIPYTYMPFGEGPRICIGMRFGLLQTKIGIITILRKFNVEPTKDTKIPIVMKGPSFVSCAKDPIFLKFVPR